MSILNHYRPLLAGLLPLMLLRPVSAQKHPAFSCQSVSFKVVLEAGGDFQRELGGGLLFRVTHKADDHGWFVDIVPAEENAKDYIYLVNPPLRLNPNQTLGPGNGETVQSSLSHAHDMKFLLDRADYDRIFKLAGNVITPSDTVDPDKAVSDYMQAVDDARKGSLRVAASSFKTGPNAALARIKLHVSITTPPDFQFAPGFYPLPAVCGL